ncbi:MAG: U32 family peptidase [Bacteroides thetaiotaomicron]|nr:U32 family peptidase [Bacteroides thetaiotaomicron]
MNLLKVGCNFSEVLPDIAKNLNQTYTNNRIDEFYGSRRESANLTARPEFRLQDISREKFCEYVQRLHSDGIEFNYTLNTNYIGSKEQINNRETEIKGYIAYLKDAGVDTITVTLPYMAELVRKVSTDIGIEVSTIAHLDSVTQIKLWEERYGITKVCMSLNKNRDVAFLRNAAEYCSKHNIAITLLANEFCGNGVLAESETGATGCIFRDHCYQLHSVGYEDNCKLENDYPMGDCISSRNSIETWVKMNYIRPEDMKLYNRIGINRFKITGRTGETEHLKKILIAYLEESFEGDLLELWKHLETINDKNETDFVPAYYIDNKKLDGFLNFWFSNSPHVCANEICGETCIYCDNYLRLTGIL